uniref:Uncharacterized protein n=1 Tax=Anguilla anguilla TaxID=7936 RepID=A0A0E9T5Z0_ANGAN
MSWPCPGWRSS